jgi:SRSO17 transposase
MDRHEIGVLDEELNKYLQAYKGCFTRSEGREHLRRYVTGQLSDLPRKSVEPMADRAGIPPRTLQDFLAAHRWDQQMGWRVLQRQVAAEHADEQAIGTIDETSFAKCGDKTIGVQRQYCGALGKIDNCVVSVHLGYSWEDSRCQCVLASDLYVPAQWLQDPEACREAGVPEELAFREKWRIALDLLREALANGLRFGWLTFDEAYGCVIAFLQELQKLGQRYVAEVPKNTMGWLVEPTVLQKASHQGQGRRRRYPQLSRKSLSPCTLENLLVYSPVLRQIPWENYYIKDTDKGPLVWRAKAHRFHLKLPVQGAQHGASLPSGELWLIVAQNPLTGETKYFVSNAAAGVPLEQLLKVAFGRWHIERCFQDQKGELGLDHFECRRYVAVQRHLLITAISHLFLTRTKRRLERGGEKGVDHVSVDHGRQRGGGHTWLHPTPAPCSAAARGANHRADAA